MISVRLHRHASRDRGTFLPQLGLALLAGRHDHVADRRTGDLIQATLDALDGDNVQVLRTGVVRAVHDGANAQTKRGPELVAHRAAAPCVDMQKATL